MNPHTPPAEIRSDPDLRLQIVLYEPEIAPNTGSIIRLAANTGAHLHLVEPLGFAWDDARLRRAGLDYHEFAHIVRHPNWTECRETVGVERNWWAFTTKGKTSLGDARFSQGDVLVFGPETRGLPADLLDAWEPERTVRLPMRPESRSLNLSNAVAIAVYEAWRQMGFPGAV